jgi:peptidyl-prolyl cis-trans isomerase D
VLVEHRVGGPVALGEGRLVIVKVLEHYQSKTKPLAEVREQVISAVRKERGTKAALQAAQDAAKKIEAGSDFDAALKGLAVTSEPLKFVGRTEADVPGPVVQAAFAGGRPDQAHPIVRALPQADGGAILVEVTGGRTEPVTAESSSEARSRQDAERKGLADMAAYVQEARNRADVEKNPNAFN